MMTLKEWYKYFAMIVTLELLMVGLTIVGFVGHVALAAILGPGYLITGATGLAALVRLYPVAKKRSELLKADPAIAAEAHAEELLAKDWRHKVTPPTGGVGFLWACIAIIFIFIGPLIGSSFAHDSETYTASITGVVTAYLPHSATADTGWDQMEKVKITLPGQATKVVSIGCHVDRNESACVRPIGSRVAIVYNPHNPTDMKLASEKTTIVLAIFLGFCSAGGWVVLFFSVRGHHRRRVWKRLHKNDPPQQPVMTQAVPDVTSTPMATGATTKPDDGDETNPTI